MSGRAKIEPVAVDNLLVLDKFYFVNENYFSTKFNDAEALDGHQFYLLRKSALPNGSSLLTVLAVSPFWEKGDLEYCPFMAVIGSPPTELTWVENTVHLPDHNGLKPLLDSVRETYCDELSLDSPDVVWDAVADLQMEMTVGIPGTLAALFELAELSEQAFVGEFYPMDKPRLEQPEADLLGLVNDILMGQGHGMDNEDTIFEFEEEDDEDDEEDEGFGYGKDPY